MTTNTTFMLEFLIEWIHVFTEVQYVNDYFKRQRDFTVSRPWSKAWYNLSGIIYLIIAADADQDTLRGQDI